MFAKTINKKMALLSFKLIIMLWYMYLKTEKNPYFINPNPQARMTGAPSFTQQIGEQSEPLSNNPSSQNYITVERRV